MYEIAVYRTPSSEPEYRYGEERLAAELMRQFCLANWHKMLFYDQRFVPRPKLVAVAARNTSDPVDPTIIGVHHGLD